MRIYLDTCALNRLIDNPSHPRVSAEADAIAEILPHAQAGNLQWIASSTLEFEIMRNPNGANRSEVLAMMEYASEFVELTDEVLSRAIDLSRHKYDNGDALHLAFAEIARCSVLLTTDSRFERRCRRGEGNPRIEVVNPIEWLQKVRPWLHKHR